MGKGNIVGEGFAKEIIGQINTRQKIFGAVNRTDSQLKYLNARSPWIKLCSSVDVDTSVSTKMGFSESGEGLASKYVLFGGVAATGGNNLLGGIGETYTVGGTSQQGYRPMPGITSIDSKNRNRGSVRETTVNIKAYNTQQFNIIDVLYLRIGYTVLLEWGHSIYVKNDGIVTDFISSDTLANSFLSGASYTDQAPILAKITENKLKFDGNYDAVYGKISNFSWSFEKDGSYTITLNIMSLGDVIESLKINTLPKGKSAAGNAPKTESEDKEVATYNYDFQILNAYKNTNALTKLFWNAKYYLNGSNFGGGLNESNLYLTNINTNMYILEAKYALDIGLENNANNVVMISEYTGENELRYYIRLGGLLSFLQNNQLIYNGKGTALLNIDFDEEKNLIYTSPYVLSSDPRICIVKTLISTEGKDANIFPGLPVDFKTEIAGTTVGKLMNVFLNMGYLAQSMNEIKDKEGKVSLFDFLSKICDGINTCLGNLNKIEPVIDEEDNNRIYFADQTTLPNRDEIIKSDKIGGSTETAKFEVYGYSPNNSSFILDLGIKTEISNDFSTMTTIGAQSNGQAVGEDATALSQWNKGLTDRFFIEKTSNPSGSNAEIATEDINTLYEDIVNEYSTFITKMEEQKFDELLDSSSEVITNFLEYMQAQESVKDSKSTPSIGFIPFNLNLSMVGLGGMKIFQKFTINNTFLPYNYPQTLEFLIKGISHKVDNNGWVTDIESFCVPNPSTVSKGANPTLTYITPPLTTQEAGGGGGANPSATDIQNAQSALSGIKPGQCLTKLFTKEIPGYDNILNDKTHADALQKSYSATFYSGPYKSGYCARYTFNHAQNYINALRGKPKPHDGATVPAGGDANDPTYWANLIKLGYTQHALNKNITKGELTTLLGGGIKFNLGDVAVYWANTGGGSPQKYGHTQMYIGKGNIKENIEGGSGWITDTYNNYGGSFVYNKEPNNCWNLLIFRVPTFLEDPIEKQSNKLYESYVFEIIKILKLADLYDTQDPKNLQPLLKNSTGFNDNEDEAVARLRSIFGATTDLKSQNATSQPWANKFPYTKLSPNHQKVWVEQFTNFLNKVNGSSSGDEYDFLFPSIKSPSFTDAKRGYVIDTDYPLKAKYKAAYITTK